MITITHTTTICNNNNDHHHQRTTVEHVLRITVVVVPLQPELWTLGMILLPLGFIISFNKQHQITSHNDNDKGRYRYDIREGCCYDNTRTVTVRHVAGRNEECNSWPMFWLWLSASFTLKRPHCLQCEKILISSACLSSSLIRPTIKTYQFECVSVDDLNTKLEYKFK